MSTRRPRLVDCAPHFVEANGKVCGLYFECPEGHDDCKHVIPFTPAMDGTQGNSWSKDGPVWARSGDTFDVMTLSPSIRRIQRYLSRDAALADGVLPEYFTESLTCALHVVLQNGTFSFCGDSR